MCTPGIHRLGPRLRNLTDRGRLNRKSLVKPKRKPCEHFRAFYMGRGEEVQDIPTYRNADFTGHEAYEAFAKYSHPEPQLNEEQQADFAQATGFMRRHFWQYMSHSPLLTADEVRNGTDQSGSPGFPWNQYSSDCNEFFESDDAAYVDEYWEKSRESLDGAFCIWNSFLKEELRKISKIEAGDIRQINGCPVEFKIAMNRFCLAMNEKFYDSHLKTASCVGLTKFHGGWNRLYKKLAKYDVGFSADVKKWDSHFPRCLFEAIRDFRFDCLATMYQSGDNYGHFKNLYEQIIRSPTILSWGEVLETRLGNPSGSPNTVVDNTLGLYVLCAYCWIRSCRANGTTADYNDFCTEIVLALYGDDNTYTGSVRGLKILDPTAVRTYSAELGFEVKFEGEHAVPVVELEFLSSHFLRVPGGMIVPKPKDMEKALASMAFRGDGSALSAWSRACAHRINSFFERRIFKVADDFCCWLRAKLDQSLADDVDWQRAKSEYLPERDIFSIYTSSEGRS